MSRVVPSGNGRPAIRQLWREAGGGTPGYDPGRFAALLSSREWQADERCAGCSADRAPHRCWWSALGASVMALRAKPRAPSRVPANTDMRLFWRYGRNTPETGRAR